MIDETKSTFGSFFHFLTFRVGTETYGVEAPELWELTTHFNLSPVPKTAHLVKGILQWRGKIVPVLDSRMMLEARSWAVRNPDEACVLVLRVKGSEGEFTAGLWADAFQELVKEAREDASSPRGPFIRKTMTGPGGNFHLLDTDRLFRAALQTQITR